MNFKKQDAYGVKEREKRMKRKMPPTLSVPKDSSLNYHNTITNFKSSQKYEINFTHKALCA